MEKRSREVWNQLRFGDGDRHLLVGQSIDNVGHPPRHLLVALRDLLRADALSKEMDWREARLVLVTFVLSFRLLVALTGRFGFTRILGLGHVLWFPLVAYLMTRTNSYPLADPFGLWMRCVIVLNSISLAIDTVDVNRYIRGER